MDPSSFSLISFWDENRGSKCGISKRNLLDSLPTHKVWQCDSEWQKDLELLRLPREVGFLLFNPVSCSSPAM
ncbi:MAG: hypothetical protein IPN76_31815 [Saprospiraceae bacterium]|nr:hypothetical protein [Saprospiraceae bacterium]